jgi:hypothetical protein
VKIKRNRTGEFDEGIIYACMQISQWNLFVKLTYANKKGKPSIYLYSTFYVGSQNLLWSWLTNLLLAYIIIGEWYSLIKGDL